MKYDMPFVSSCSAITESDIENLNKQLNLTVPRQYVDFLLQHNGGQPDLNLFKGYDKKGELIQVSINVLFGICEERVFNIFTRNVMNRDLLSRDFLAIGDDGVGNVICIGVSEKLYGKIYILYTDFAEGGGKKGTSGFKNIDFVCDSFEDLFKGLVSEDEFE